MIISLKSGVPSPYQKPAFNSILSRLKEDGYLPIGPRVKNETLVYEAIENLEDLPQGYSTDTETRIFSIDPERASRVISILSQAHIHGSNSCSRRAQNCSHYVKTEMDGKQRHKRRKHPSMHLSACAPVSLAAIQIQDNIFMRTDFTDPIYRARRERAVIISVNCTHPAETCFCTSMGTGPRVKDGFDLNMTELDDVFVLTIGSDLARRLLTGVPFEDARGYVLTNVEHKTRTRGATNEANARHKRFART